MSLNHVHQSFEVKTTITFGLDEANEPTAVTVEGLEFLTRGAIRLFAQESLDSYFGNYSHGFEVSLSPFINEESPEPEGTMTFDVHKTHDRLMREARGE